ncbi:hypothetical protein [Neisseria dumasiana]|uniref:Uncharacterized protein n=1 Tax=Neisseria dumasiana TaxID=1931275 RepID=A0A1X3DL05_9NEIS|nr:hypothetical protein [Neisseria dumasiana]OSI25082.1 hypothetical protein BV912_01520 [Neisseria dumasiana]
MKKGLIALALSVMSRSAIPEFNITPLPVYQLRQHPSIRAGRSGIAAAKRAARKARNRRKAK